jgi:hypothetical protein
LLVEWLTVEAVQKLHEISSPLEIIDEERMLTIGIARLSRRPR